MDESLVALAEALASNGRNGRQDLLEAEVRQRQADAARRDEHLMRYHAQNQVASCIRELHDRADLVWKAYVRVLSDAGAQWKPSIRKQILDRVAKDVEQDAAQLDELARTLLAPFHSFNLPVHEAAAAVLERVGIELDLFALRYQPTPSALAEQLCAPRYAAAKTHLAKSNGFLVANPADLPNAVNEAVKMVEAIAKLVTGNANYTLGKCIGELKRNGIISPVDANALNALWASANQESGVRHAHNAKDAITDEQADFYIESAHAAAKLLLALDR